MSVTRLLPIPAAEAFALLTDLRSHARWIPMTRVHVPPGPPRLGALVTAVSGPLTRRGAPGLVDRMRIDRLDPPDPAAGTPGVAVFAKLGPVLLGESRMEVAPAGPRHSRVTWSERAWLAGPVPAAALVAPVLRGMLALALARVARELRRRASPSPGPGR
ncbi:SRPBCC family protein [Cellulomonas timonensis]|uniref:SRPBCC family protein n=1 Tax=Cellulomonas timonensis TaxID=1689271 RepID=UPI0008338290|nr:SRPBCC family protein [Cellulomonas timonensis]